MTSANMPYFDIVTYCEIATRKHDTALQGPVYDTCAGNQAHYRSIIGAAIDAKRFKEAKVVQCAKASRSAYEGMWYCMNDQPYSDDENRIRTVNALAINGATLILPAPARRHG